MAFFDPGAAFSCLINNLSAAKTHTGIACAYLAILLIEDEIDDRGSGAKIGSGWFVHRAQGYKRLEVFERCFSGREHCPMIVDPSYDGRGLVNRSVLMVFGSP